MKMVLQTVTQNGIERPRRETLAGEAWAMFDELGPSFVVKTAIALGTDRGLNPNNIRTELCRWRRFHGIRM